MAPQIFPHHESKFKNEYKNTKNIILFPRSYFQETFWKKKNFPSNRLWKSLQGRHEKRPQSGHTGMPAF